jgi:hypothetical protein
MMFIKNANESFMSRTSVPIIAEALIAIKSTPYFHPTCEGEIKIGEMKIRSIHYHSNSHVIKLCGDHIKYDGSEIPISALKPLIREFLVLEGLSFSGSLRGDFTYGPWQVEIGKRDTVRFHKSGEYYVYPNISGKESQKALDYDIQSACGLI